MKRSSFLTKLARVCSLPARPLYFLVAGLMLVVILGVLHNPAPRSVVSSVFAAANLRAQTSASMSADASIQAAGRGKPYINFGDGHDVMTGYGASSNDSGALQSSTSPLSMASADFDGDGVPDLISGYAAGGAGMIVLHRGNVDSIYPNAPEAQQRKASGSFTESPFLSPARVFDLSQAADFTGAGDFDADGHWDVVTASRADNALYLLSGDGHGDFNAARRIELPGRVTAFATGEINRADGLTDIVVGVAAVDGPRALVFEGPEGALKAQPETFTLAAEPASFALGRLDDDNTIDLAIADGSELTVVFGRDRKLSMDETRQKEVPRANVSRRAFPFTIRSVAIGDFKGDHKTCVSLLSDQGSVHLLTPAPPKKAKKKKKAVSIESWKDETLTTGDWNGATSMIAGRLSSTPCDGLVILDSARRKLHMVASSKAGEGIQAANFQPVSFDVDSEPTAVMPMRLNSDALSDLVVLRKGQVGPVAVITQPTLVFPVSSNADSGAGSLRDAITQANANAGLDTISFVIGVGPQTIMPLSQLPAITEAVVIDGTTQPGFAGSPIIEMDGTNAGLSQGISVTGGNSTVRGLVMNRYQNVASSSGQLLVLNTAGNNIIEGNFLGTNIGGAAIPGPRVRTGVLVFTGSGNNTIGGLVAAARNVISGCGFFGIQINSGTGGDVVLGNFIGTDVSGTVALGNAVGVTVQFETNVSIGSAAPGGGNIISSSDTHGIQIQAAANGNVVQGNFIGTDATGTADLGNTQDGINLSSSANNTIGGSATGTGNVISGNNANGIFIDHNSNGTQIKGNIIGLDANGNNAIGNTFDGITIFGSSNTVIGGASVAERNIISSNGFSGIAAFANVNNPAGNQILGNYIGLDATGTLARGNTDHGLFLDNTLNSVIGGTAPLARNVISANLQGVRIGGAASTGNQILGNFIGTDATGTLDLGNTQHGVNINNSANNTVGGTAAGSRNVISGNNLNGILIINPGANGNQVVGNFIGIDASGTTDLGNSSNGIFVNNAPNTVIGGTTASARNVISGNDNANGIRVDNASATGTIIQGNYVGTDAAGIAAIPNSGSAIRIANAHGATIGGTSAGAGNLVSGNGGGAGINLIPSSNNVIQGNFIGTNAAGTAALPNVFGIQVTDTSNNNQIGGTTPLARNVISGNQSAGISITTPGLFGAGAPSGNIIQGNHVGTDVTGTAPVGNGEHGVRLVLTGSNIAPSNNTIGGTANGAANLIAFNTGDGVSMFNPDPGPFNGTGNSIQGNSIHSNTELAIDLNNDGVTANDGCDTDAGPNNAQNSPVLTAAFPSGSRHAIQGTINSTANATFTIQFFANSACDPSGFGEGEHFLGSTLVTTDQTCNASFTFLADGVLPGQSITATATDQAGNTSEFSNCIAIGAGALNVAITKSVSPTAVRPGNNVTYTITVTNKGPAVATNVALTDNLPSQLTFVSCTASSGTCGGSGNNRSLNLPQLSVNASATLTIVATVNPSIANGTIINNTATVTASLGETPATATATVPVTVSTQAPAITCPSNVLAATAQGQTSTLVNYPAPTLGGNPPNVSVTCVPPSGSAFPLGTTAVTCTATDAANNISSCSFNVTVNQGNPSLDNTDVDFGDPIALPNQNPPTDTFTITNASAVSVDLSLASISRTGGDVGGRITNPDDSGFFTVFVINPGGADTQLSLGSTIPIPAGSRNFRVMFNPSVPSVASGTSNLSASQVLPDVVRSSVTFNVSGGGTLTVNLTGRVAAGLSLIDPADPTRSPVVTFSRSGNQFNLTYSVFDSNLNVTRASYQFLDNGGQPTGGPVEVNLAQALQAVNLVKGQSFTVDQPFSGASSHPEVAGVRVTVFDGETSGSATANLGSSAASNAPTGDVRRMTVALPRVRIKRFNP